MGIIRRHPIPFAILGFILITLPGAVDAYWSLAEKVRGVTMPNLDVSWLDWILPIIGLSLLLLIIYQTGKKETPPSKQQRQPLSATQADQVDSEFVDALQHVLVQGQRHTDLTIQKAYNPWRILYPIFIRNTRPLTVDIIGFNLTVLWDDSPVQRVTWKAPEGEASNGIPLRPKGERIEAFRIQPDDEYRLETPVNGSQIPNLPTDSPIWRARGTLFLQSGSQERELQFDLDTDRYRVEERNWQEWRGQFGL